MIRRGVLFLVSVVSLLACAGSLALWPRSYRVSDLVWRGFVRDTAERSQFRALSAQTDWGVINIGYVKLGLVNSARSGVSPDTELMRKALSQQTARAVEEDLAGFRGMLRTQPLWTTGNPPGFVPRNPTLLRRLGFHVVSDSWSLPDAWHSEIDFTCPIWFVSLVTGVLPAWYGWRVGRRRYRLRHNRCLGCGYDLRASAGVCPECGREISSVPGKGRQ